MEDSKEPSFKELSSQKYIGELAFRLLAIDKNRNVFASGTCFRIAGGAFLTAKHVIEDFFDKFSKEELTNEIEADFSIWAIQLLESEELYAIWAVHKLWMVPNSDIAFLQVIPYCENAAKIKEPKQVKLNLFPPKIGSRIVGFGYHDSHVDKTNITNNVLNIIADDTASATVGEVMEIYELYRDKVRLNFPSFSVNARFDGGMSGGPVFNDDGEVCGIICSSLPANEEYNEHTSYVTTLWPLMGMRIDADRDGDYPKNVTYPVLDLAKDGIISSVNWEHVATEIYKFDISYIEKQSTQP